MFSPHLDDATLDCSDHILAWKRLGLHVRVVTVFTKSASPSPERLTGDSSADLEHRRKREDKMAMGLLGVSWNHLSFADWAFRHKYEGAYCTNEQPERDPNDRILRALTKAIVAFRNSETFIIPLAIGGHIDHVLVRGAAEIAAEPARLCYYLDYPYALSVLNWTGPNILKVMRARKSVKIMSEMKKQLLETYSSQIPQIFSHTRFSMPWITWSIARSYPEIVLYHKDTRLSVEKADL